MTQGEVPKRPDPTSVLATMLQEMSTVLKDAEVDQQLRDFLERWPLYRRLTIRMSQGLWDFPKSISLECDDAACENEPTTTWLRQPTGAMGPGRYVEYICAHCQRNHRAFWIEVRDQLRSIGVMERSFQKIGQIPGWGINPPKEVGKALGESNRQLYRNGLVCMSQSYGIGALAYFRRVVENAVNDLLSLVEEAARTDGDETALEAVEAARKRKNADEKLQLVAEVVPLSLRPGGANPLANLYADYSRGIHSLSDEECLQIATDMQDALEYVFGNLRDKLEQAKAFRDRITKRAGPSASPSAAKARRPGARG